LFKLKREKCKFILYYSRVRAEFGGLEDGIWMEGGGGQIWNVWEGSGGGGGC